MAQLTIVVDVQNVDPTVVDPHEVAENVIDYYMDFQKYNGWSPAVVFESAEWSD